MRIVSIGEYKMLEIRNLSHRDLPDLRAHLSGLDGESLRNRFNSVVIPERLDAYVAAINFNRDVVMGAYTHDGKLVGAAHVTIFHADGFPVGELGVTVDKAHRKQGIGLKLINFARRSLRDQGATDFYILTQRTNTPMRILAKKLGGTYTVEDGDVQVRFQIQPRNERRRILAHTIDGVETFRGPIISDKAPLAILLHGAGGEAWQWRKLVMPHLHEGGVESIALTLPTAQGTANVLGAIREIVSANSGRAIVLVGHSMGGYLAQSCVASMPEGTFQGLVLVCSVPPDGAVPAGQAAVRDHIQNLMPSNEAREMLDRFLGVAGRFDVSDVNCPVVCIAGRHDKVVPMAWSRAMAETYDADLLCLEGGHDIMQSFGWRAMAETVVERAQQAGATMKSNDFLGQRETVPAI